MFYKLVVKKDLVSSQKLTAALMSNTRTQKLTNTLFHTLFYNTIKAQPNNACVIITRPSTNQFRCPLPLIRRISRISGLSDKAVSMELRIIIWSLVNQYSFNPLYFFFKKLFWLVPVPKHKQLLYSIRALIKYASSQMPSADGISVSFRGKLAATGNKRKSSFTCLVGRGASSSFNLTKASEFRLLRTPVGVIGVTSIITYTR